MGKLYTGTFNRTSNFKLAKAAPLDDRDVVQSRDDLWTMNWERFVYNTMIVKVANTNELWMLIDATDTRSIYNWKCIYGESSHNYEIRVDTKGITQLSSAEILSLHCDLYRGEINNNDLVSKWKLERISVNNMEDVEWNASHTDVTQDFTISGFSDLSLLGNNIFTIKAIDSTGATIASYVFTLRKDITIIEALTPEAKTALVKIVQEDSLAGHYNYVANGGFSGQDKVNEFSSSTSLTEDSLPIYSNFNKWNYSNCEIIRNPVFITGFGCHLSTQGFLNQTIDKTLNIGEEVTLNITAKAPNGSSESTLTIIICGYTVTLTLGTEYANYRQTFTIQDGTQVIKFSGRGILGNIALYKGVLRSDYIPQLTESQVDSRNEYLRQTFSDNSSEYPGSAKSDKLIRLGNAGISGGYSNGSELAFWSGEDDIDNILFTANTFRDQPFKEDTNSHCKYLVTQDGFLVALNTVAHGQFKGIFNGTLQGNQQLAYRILFPDNFNENEFFDLSKLDSIWWFQEYGNIVFNSNIHLELPRYIENRWYDCKQSRLHILASIGSKIIIKNNTHVSIFITYDDPNTPLEITPNSLVIFTLNLDTSHSESSQIKWSYENLSIDL